MRRSLGIIFATCLIGSASARAGAPAGDVPASTMPTNTFQAQLQERLQSADPAVRAAAQKELADIAAFWHEPDMLEQMANATDDPGLKALFKDRAAALRGAALENQTEAVPDPMHLAPLSLKLDDTSFDDTIEALNKALGGHYLVAGSNPGGGAANGGAVAAATLDVHDKSFWEVVQELEAKQPFSLASSATDASMRAMPQPANIMQGAQIGEPAILIPGQMTYRRTMNLQADGAAAHTSALTVPLTLMVDPRVTVSSYGMIVISKITDETGQTLVQPQTAPSPQNFVAQSNIRTQQTTFSVGIVPGKRLNFTCDIRITAATENVTSIIEDVEHAVNKSVALGGRSVRIAQAKISADRQLSAQVVVSVPPGGGAERADARLQSRLFDADGKVVWSSSSPGSTSFTTSVATASGPFKLVLTSAGKTEDIPLHFELKDIPLP